MPSPLDLLRRVTQNVGRSRYGWDKLPPRAAQLFDRVASDAPMSAQVFHPGPLSRVLLEASLDDPKRQLLGITPNEFLRLAAPLEQSTGSAAQVDALKGMLGRRASLPDHWGDTYYTDAYPKFRGFGDVPFLISTAAQPYPRIIGHEGRHRMNAIGELYGWDTPLAIRGDRYNGATRNPDRILPENITPSTYIDNGLEHLLEQLSRPAPSAWRDGGRVP